MSIDEAVDALLKAGLTAKRVSKPDDYIVGGTTRTVVSGIGIYDNPFTIIPEDGEWLVVREGIGSTTRDQRVSTLTEAVALIVEGDDRE